jgi:hypothetical protein
LHCGCWVSNGTHSTAQGLIADLDNTPLEIQQAADEEMKRQDNCQASQTAPKKARKKEAHARVNSADACGRQFRRRHAILKAAIHRADADDLQIRNSVARYFQKLALEDPLLVAEVSCLNHDDVRLPTNATQLVNHAL